MYAIAMILSALALGAADVTAVTATDWASVITAMTGQFSVSTVVAVLASLVTAAIGLVFMWWGVRKATRSLLAAAKKGKLKL